MVLASVDDRRIVMPPVPASPDESLLNRPDRHQHHDHQKRGEDRDSVVAESNGHAERSRDPDRSRSGQPVNVIALTEDRARAKEPDAGYDLCRDARRVNGFSKSGKESQGREHAGPDGDQSHGLDSGRMTSKLPFNPESEAEKQGDYQAETKVDLAGYRQRLSLGPDGPRACPAPRVRLSRQARREARAGRGCSQSRERQPAFPHRPEPRL